MNRMRILRHRLDLKQAEFAELLQMSLTAYARYERGITPLPPKAAEKLALLEGALTQDAEVGVRLAAAWEGKTGHLRVLAAWAVLAPAGVAP